MRVLAMVVLAACSSAPGIHTVDVPSPITLAGGSPAVAFADAKKLFPDAPRECADAECLIEHAYARDPRPGARARALQRTAATSPASAPTRSSTAGTAARSTSSRSGRSASTASTCSGPPTRSPRSTTSSRSSSTTAAPAYRWRALQLRFVRSVGKRTPSAYALGWIVEYNVEGSLLDSSPACARRCSTSCFTRTTAHIATGRRRR